MAKALVVYGSGIGCHEDAKHAFEKAGAKAELVHISELFSGKRRLYEAQILNFSGGFLHGDILGAGMAAANELMHAEIKEGEQLRRMKDLLLEFVERQGIIYGQCNGFQLLVKTGLLPGVNNDYSKQTLTLTNNDCGSYRVDFVPHKVERKHFAFKGIDEVFWIWCRHGEGKIQFYSPYGQISKKEAQENREAVNQNHVILRYVDPFRGAPTENFSDNPNGSVDGIAGLCNSNGHIFAHMAHTEATIYLSRDPRFWQKMDELRRQGIPAEMLTQEKLEAICAKVFKNIVNYVK